MRRLDLSLYVIIDRAIEITLPIDDFTRQVIAGGATCIQVRMKHDSPRDILAVTSRVIAIARPLGVPVIVNDRVDLALAAGADGVHVGEDDLPVRDARRIGGPSMVVGASAANLDAALRAAREGADYVGVGPVFATPSKPEARALAPGTIAAVRRGISLPIVAIGGINEANLAIPLGEGADGIAIISALRQCPFPGEVAARLQTAIAKSKKR